MRGDLKSDDDPPLNPNVLHQQIPVNVLDSGPISKHWTLDLPTTERRSLRCDLSGLWLPIQYNATVAHGILCAVYRRPFA